MTQEQFDRVCEIVRYIDLLEFAKKDMRSFQNISHTFCPWYGYNEKWEVLNIKAIASILGTPKELIIQKIDNRINELKKEIEGIYDKKGT